MLLDYASDLRACVDSLVQGGDFSEAHRLVRDFRILCPCSLTLYSQITMHKTPDLILEILHPAALETRAQISEDLEEMRTQLRKQLSRLRELRVKKVEEPGGCYSSLITHLLVIKDRKSVV